MTTDRLIIGGGMFGLYAAKLFAEAGKKTIVLEQDDQVMTRASFVNQARVHLGYHYPRSMATARQAGGYFGDFCQEFGDCIADSFTKIYATSAHFSWTNATEFRRFCEAAGMPCEEVDASRYFRSNMVDGAFLTKEYSFDAVLIREKLLAQLAKMPLVEIRTGCTVTAIRQEQDYFVLTAGGEEFSAPYVFNATYASANEMLGLAGFDPLPTKYELCEIILGTPSEALREVGLTVMDGPFFSVMPFGKTPYHSLTAVCFTPHATSFDTLPTFSCMEKREDCSPQCLQNCDFCPHRPQSAMVYMSGLMHKYCQPEYDLTYERSHFAMKLILKASEVDDSRPTVIWKSHEGPTFVTILSGKINTIYDLMEVCRGE